MSISNNHGNNILGFCANKQKQPLKVDEKMQMLSAFANAGSTLISQLGYSIQLFQQ